MHQKGGARAHALEGLTFQSLHLPQLRCLTATSVEMIWSDMVVLVKS